MGKNPHGEGHFSPRGFYFPTGILKSPRGFRNPHGDFDLCGQLFSKCPMIHGQNGIGYTQWTLYYINQVI